MFYSALFLIFVVATTVAYPTGNSNLYDQRGLECNDNDVQCNVLKRNENSAFAQDAEALFDLMKYIKFKHEAQPGKLGSFNAPIIGKRSVRR